MTHTDSTSLHLDRAARLSRYVRRLFDARPQLRSELAATLAAPLSRSDMAACLTQEGL